MKREGLEDKKTTPEEHRLCRLILSLALLPAEKIDPTFTALYAQTSGRVKLVCDYIDYQWIDDNAFFNPSTWSQYMQHTRTTNSHDHDEGWHNRMKSAADRKSKLNFYQLVELLYYQVSLVPLQCALLCQNKLREHSTKAAGSTNKKLFDLWELYNTREINLKQLHVLVTEVMDSVYTARLNTNIPVTPTSDDPESE